jgi:hypothetical protein
VAKKVRCTFSITAEIGKKSILDVTHLLPGGIARYVRARLQQRLCWLVLGCEGLGRDECRAPDQRGADGMGQDACGSNCCYASTEMNL